MPRVNVNISDELKEYFESLSKETGASQSALMAIALRDYVEQKKAINQLPSMFEQLKVMEAMFANKKE